MTRCYDDDADDAEEHELISVKVGDRIVVEAISVQGASPPPQPQQGMLYVKGHDGQFLYAALLTAGVNVLHDMVNTKAASIWIEWVE